MNNEQMEANEGFTFHFPSQPKKKLVNLDSCDKLSKRCWDIYQGIINKRKRQFCYQILRSCNQFYGQLAFQKRVQEGKKSMKEQEAMMNQSKEALHIKIKSPKRLIIPIIVSKNQVQYIQQFLDHLVQKIKTFKNKITSQFDFKDNIYDEINKSSLHRARQINIFSKPDCNKIAKICFFMYHRLKRLYLQEDVWIYIAREVTDLSNQNLHFFEESLSEFNCVIIVPTYQKITQIMYQSFPTSQITPVRIVQPKKLFIQLMFETICDPQIMAYLPKESIKLLDDFDDFPISFKEGTRRLIYCIQKLETLRQRRRVKFQHVQIKPIFKAIQQSIKEIFMFFRSTHLTTQKYIRCILDENQQFNILDNYLSKNIYFTKEEEGMRTKSQLVSQMRQELINNIEKCKTIKAYSIFLKEQKKQKHGIQENYYYLKTQLEQDLKNVISKMAKSIRNQAKKFDWQDYSYVQTIKPMLPYNIFNSVMTSKAHNQLIEYIFETLFVPLWTIIFQFCQFRKWSYGKLMYYMQDLELYGLIDISDDRLDPIVSVNYFEKFSSQTYRMQQEEKVKQNKNKKTVKKTKRQKKRLIIQINQIS